MGITKQYMPVSQNHNSLVNPKIVYGFNGCSSPQMQ